MIFLFYCRVNLDRNYFLEEANYKDIKRPPGDQSFVLGKPCAHGRGHGTQQTSVISIKKDSFISKIRGVNVG